MKSDRRDDRMAWWRDPSPHVTHTAWVRFFARPAIRRSRMPLLVSIALLLFGLTHATAQDMNSIKSIEGTCTLAFADVLHPDGTRGPDYGSKPKGMLQVDSAGRYAVVIFDGSRPLFASADKKTGTDAEI